MNAIAAVLLSSMLLAGSLPAPKAHTYVPSYTSPADADGNFTVNIPFPGQPVVVPAGGMYQYAYYTTVPNNARVLRVWSFIGSSTAAIYEADINLKSGDGPAIYQRSDHKEVPANYDAWQVQPANWRSRTTGTQYIVLEGVAYGTGPAPATLHWEIRLEMKQVQE